MNTNFDSLPFNERCAQRAFEIAEANLAVGDTAGRLALQLLQMRPDETAQDRIYDLTQKMIDAINPFLQKNKIPYWYVYLPNAKYKDKKEDETNLPLFFIGKIDTETGHFNARDIPVGTRHVNNGKIWVEDAADNDNHFYLPVQKSFFGLNPSNWGWVAFLLPVQADMEQTKLKQALKKIIESFSDNYTSRHSLERAFAKSSKP